MIIPIIPFLNRIKWEAPVKGDTELPERAQEGLPTSLEIKESKTDSGLLFQYTKVEICCQDCWNAHTKKESCGCKCHGCSSTEVIKDEKIVNTSNYVVKGVTKTGEGGYNI